MSRVSNVVVATLLVMASVVAVNASLRHHGDAEVVCCNPGGPD
jgi:hypothetical protein